MIGQEMRPRHERPKVQVEGEGGAWGRGRGMGAWGEGSDVECGWAIMGVVVVSLCRRGRSVPCW